jgi:hypothetical protein
MLNCDVLVQFICMKYTGVAAHMAFLRQTLHTNFGRIYPTAREIIARKLVFSTLH